MKIILWIVLAVVLTFVGAGIYIVVNSGSLIKQAIESEGPRYLGVPVTVDKVELSLTEGKGEIRGLQIGNPPGYAGPYLLHLGRAKIVVDPGQVSEKAIVIKEVLVDGAMLELVAKGTEDTNIQALLDHIDKAGGSGGNSKGSQSAEPEVRVIINKLDFINTHANINSDLLGKFSYDVPDLHLKNIGKAKNGATMGEVMEEILEPLKKSITKEMINKGLGVDEFKEKAKSRFREKLQERLSKYRDRDKD